ncbi:integrase [Olsenella sp. oral taxon 807]|uniref:IS630 family transposase n=1 Tax=Olsenella sp. oral taxon 807 TaxID=712411 RepID=UPI00067A0F83|nr:IS630 family transposase [Olsenella sp. oral taxon 807]AKT49578.1 integrase [Olsenella sp. oral taxon 807]
MAGSKTAVALGEKDRERLERLARMRTAQAQTVTRARILLLRDSGETLVSIAEKVGLAVNSVRLCVTKYLEGGVEHALSDDARSGRPREVDDADRAFVVDLACQRPADLGYATKLWTNDLLTAHVRKTAEAAGHPRLATVATGTVHNILANAQLKLHKMTYYCERRDPNLEAKTRDVLLLHEQLPFRFDEDGNLIPWEEGQEARVLSYDKKPDTQDAREHCPDLRHEAGGRGTVGRDYEYGRLETLSLLASIDLLTGEATPLVSETHKSSDYVEFLKILDGKYPKGDLIRIVLDDVSARTSAETRHYLTTVPGRFEFVSAPKHGSWLNLVEGLFSRMTRQMLRGIRVSRKDELKERILRYFREVNAEPVAYRWKWNLSDIDPTTEELVVDTLLSDEADKAR